MNNRIKAVRKAKGLTLIQFGEAVGISAQSVSKLENNLNNPSEQTLRAICTVFGVDDTWLRTGVGEMFPVETPRAERIAAYMGQLLSGKRSDLESLLIELMAETSPEDWAGLEKALERIIERFKKPDTE